MQDSLFRFHHSKLFKVSKEGLLIKPDGTKINYTSKSKSGFKRFCIGKLTLYVHKVVAETWVDNPNEYTKLYFIDKDKSNVSASNLIWISNHADGLRRNMNLDYYSRVQKKRTVRYDIAYQRSECDIMKRFYQTKDKTEIENVLAKKKFSSNAYIRTMDLVERGMCTNLLKCAKFHQRRKYKLS